MCDSQDDAIPPILQGLVVYVSLVLHIRFSENKLFRQLLTGYLGRLLLQLSKTSLARTGSLNVFMWVQSPQ